MPRFLSTGKKKRKRKKKKVLKFTLTEDVRWRLPKFPYEEPREVIIGGKMVTTLDILDIPGKSNTGWTVPSKDHSEKYKSGKHSFEVNGNGKTQTEIDEGKKDDIGELNEMDNEKVCGGESGNISGAEDDSQTEHSLMLEETSDANLNTGNENVKMEEGCVKDSSSKKLLSGHSQEMFHLRHYTVLARVINFLRKISLETRLGYPIAVKMSVKPKVL